MITVKFLAVFAKCCQKTFALAQFHQDFPCTSRRLKYDETMSDAYHQLLDATIQHLEGLKARGVRFVPVQPASLAALAGAPRSPQSRPAVSAAPAPAPKPVERPKAAAVPLFSAPIETAAPEITPAVPILSPEAKAAAFADLRTRALACVKCPNLASSRKNVVFGVGNIDAPVMFVGEAPGADEDEQGEPFVGKAGQLLTKIIQTMGFQRETIYIANILKCRPDTPGQAAGNRKPTPEEMQTCIPYLHEQIDLIRPKVLVALGATAAEGLLGKPVGITKLRGQWCTYRNIPLMPTYHPSYLLHTQSLSEKRRVWEDMLAVMEKLGLPISEKQRNFFLKG
jgi:uracil-DNA glycosylase family 4